MKQIFVIAFAFWSTFITAQETMSLKDCVNYALKNHTSISMAKNDLESAVARKNEGRSAYLPQVNAQISWDDNIIKQSTMMPAFPPLTTEPMKLEIGPKFNTIAGIQLDQTIFNMSYIEGIRALKPNEELNKLKLQKTEEDVIYNTVAAYYQLLIINENEKLLNESEVRINKTLPIVQLQYDKGVARKIDVDKIKVNLNNILANKEILRINKSMAMNNLKYTIGMPLETEIVIDPKFENEVSTDILNNSDNVKDKVELKLLNTSLILNEINYRRQKAAYYPTIAFAAKYAGNALGDKLADSFKKWTQLAVVGVKITVPIFDGLRNSSALKQMSLNNENIKYNIKQTEDGLKLQLQNAKTGISNAVQNYTINKENLELAKSIFDVTTLQYQKGVVSYTEVLSSEFSYKEAEVNYLQSLVKYLNYKLELDKANNNIQSYK